MLDKLVLHIPFKPEYLVKTGNRDDTIRYHVPLENIPVPLKADTVERNDDGSFEVSGLSTKFESLPSSHSGMAMKVYNDGLNCDPFVAIHCSPVKLLQGHNLYGFDDMKKSAINMMALLASVYPELYEMLSPMDAVVSEFDVTYSTFISNQQTKKLFLDHLGLVSKGQTKNRGDNYATTRYFGSKNSRLKKGKVYSKHEEMLEDANKQRKKGFINSAELIETLANTDYAKSAVRFEATIKKRYLERRGIPVKIKHILKHIDARPDFYREIWQEAWKDVFEALSGQEITQMTDNKVYEQICKTHSTVTGTGKVSLVKANRLFSFYQTLKALGYEHLKPSKASKNKMYSDSAFYRNIADLEACGLARSVLQNIHNDCGSVVIPMARLINIDFGDQVPSDYSLPADLFAA